MDLAKSTAQVMQGAAQVVGSTLRYGPEPVSRAADFIGALGGATTNETIHNISPEYKELIERQIATQLEHQQVSFTSNIEKSRHDSRMAALRNIRVA